MILKRLFKQYKKGAKQECFGSWFASLMGKLLIGTPSQYDMGELSNEIQSSFYNRQADRWIPKDVEGMNRWKEDSKFVTEVRAAGEPVVGKAVALAAIVACFALSALTMLVVEIKTDSPKDEGISAQVSAQAAPVGNTSGCQEIYEEADAHYKKTRQMTPSQISQLTVCRDNGFMPR